MEKRFISPSSSPLSLAAISFFFLFSLTFLACIVTRSKYLTVSLRSAKSHLQQSACECTHTHSISAGALFACACNDGSRHLWFKRIVFNFYFNLNFEMILSDLVPFGSRKKSFRRAVHERMRTEYVCRLLLISIRLRTMQRQRDWWIRLGTMTLITRLPDIWVCVCATFCLFTFGGSVRLIPWAATIGYTIHTLEPNEKEIFKKRLKCIVVCHIWWWWRARTGTLRRV